MLWKSNPLNRIRSVPLRRLAKIAIAAAAVAAGGWATTQTDNPEIGKAVTEAIEDFAPGESPKDQGAADAMNLLDSPGMNLNILTI